MQSEAGATHPPELRGDKGCEAFWCAFLLPLSWRRLSLPSAPCKGLKAHIVTLQIAEEAHDGLPLGGALKPGWGAVVSEIERHRGGGNQVGEGAGLPIVGIEGRLLKDRVVKREGGAMALGTADLGEERLSLLYRGGGLRIAWHLLERRRPP